jgi:hypothetical protein
VSPLPDEPLPDESLPDEDPDASALDELEPELSWLVLEVPPPEVSLPEPVPLLDVAPLLDEPPPEVSPLVGEGS